MATAKIKYVGLKERETAFSVETSIVWTPDAVESVDLKHVALMLKHPDVFALVDAPVGLADAKSTEPPAPPVNAPTDKGKLVQWANTPDGEMVVLSDMSREELHALAKAHGVKVHHTSGASKVIEALQAAFAVKKPE